MLDDNTKPPATPFGSANWAMLLIMCVAVFCVNFNTTAVANALTAIQTQLNLSSSAAQWTINIYLLTAASLIIIGGQLGDMFGRRNLFFIGILSFCVAGIMIGLANSAIVLLIGRVLQGIGAAIITPAALAIAKISFKDEHQNLVMSVITGAMGLGYAVGPSLGGFLTVAYSWKAIFWTMVPVTALVALLTPFKLALTPASVQPVEQKQLDLLGLVLFVFGMVPFVLGLVQGNAIGWIKMETLGLLIGGSIMLVLFWLVESYSHSPLVDFSHFEKKLFALGIAGLGNTIFSLLTILYFFNLYMQNALLLNYSNFEAGVAILPASASMFLCSLFSARSPLTISTD